MPGDTLLTAFAVNMSGLRIFCHFFVQKLCRNDQQVIKYFAYLDFFEENRAKKSALSLGGVDNAHAYEAGLLRGANTRILCMINIKHVVCQQYLC
jgi:hypothetical protein